MNIFCSLGDIKNYPFAKNLSIMKYKTFIQNSKFLNTFFIVYTLFAASITSMGQQNIAVSPNKMNVFYIGVDNPVSIAASGEKDEKVTVTTDGGGSTVSKVSTGIYNVKVTTITDDCTVNVSIDGKLVGTSKFRVRSLPTPSATVGGFASGSKVPADKFNKQYGVALYVKDFPFDVKYNVIGYTVSVESDGDVKSADCNEGAFSSTAKEYISKYVTSGKTVIIDNIRAKDEAGRELKIPALMYHIE